MRLTVSIGAAALVFGLAGCAAKPPAIVEAEGDVTINGQPLPMVQVTFIPDLKDFGAEYNSTAIADEKGHFVLTCALNNMPGAAAGTHRVLITEYTPAEARGQDPRAQARQAAYAASLKNRPIPEMYTNLAKTITIEVAAGQKQYDLKLKR